MSPKRFGWTLTAIAAGGLIVRVAYVLVSRRDVHPGGDAFFYHAGANLLADGKGFISPFFIQQGRHVQAAEHPPLYMLFLSIPSFLGMHSALTHMLWSCTLGTASVVFVGLVGRAVAGPRAGIIAAVVAALYPNMWAPDGMLQAESLAILASIVTVWLAYRYLAAPSWPRLVFVGLAAGAGAMARSELILLVPLLVVPLALATRRESWSHRLLWLGAAVLAALAVIAPWSTYNATRFKHPILLSAQFDPLLASANCDAAYNGRLAGYYDIECAHDVYVRAGLTQADDESQEDIVYRRAALHYMRAHMGRLTVVEGIRMLRILGAYHPQRSIIIDSYVEGRDEWIARDGIYSFWVIGGLAIAGAILLRRRRTTVYPLLAPIGVVVITVLTTYASTRFRASAEPVLVVLAAVAIEAVTRFGRGSDRSSAPQSS
jgi:4-amino-4-deoxy-L-arabinose transferase-like glycosyltransferase